MRHLQKAISVYALAAILGLTALACLYTKHDIHVTLDIRHIQETATDIEDVVSGEKELGQLEEQSGAALLASPRPGLAALFSLTTAACADEDDEGDEAKVKKLTPALKKAIENRKKRFEEIRKYKSAGAIGENNAALLDERPSPLLKDEKEGPKIKALVKAENADRMTIYKEIAGRNDAKRPEDLAKIQKAWAKIHREKSKPRDWIQAPEKKEYYEDFLKEKWAKKLTDKPKPGSWLRMP
ncbi:MAG TPA: DUF1318 domain-containing protein [Sumerlaeia bacterium]|nr:DUF1318 domain-containing protein [Sumerlaeia bacterium]